MSGSAADFDGENPTLWQVTAAHRAPQMPPYPSSMIVTPLSKFDDANWVYPLTWASLNNRNRLIRNHVAPIVFADAVPGSLVPEQDVVLVRQLKEACWAATHHGDLLGRIRIPKPLTEYGIHQRYRRLIIGFKRLGCSSLAGVGQAELDEVLRLLAPPPAEFNSLVYWFSTLGRFSSHGLIKDGLRNLKFEVAGLNQIPDSSSIQGIQPLADEDAGSIIRISLAYIDLAPEIAGKVRLLRKSPQQLTSVLRWARRKLPCGPNLNKPNLLQTLVAIVHVASGNLIMFHLGLRISELLSVVTGFFSNHEDSPEVDIKKMTMEFWRYKAIRGYLGRKTRVEIHPILDKVASALEIIKEASGTDGCHLFTPVGGSAPYLTNSWNYYLQRFCDIHSVGVSISSHQWRETVAAIAVRVLTGPSMYLKELFGHTGLSMTARYMFASPFILDEVKDRVLDVYRKRGKTLLDSLTAFGGPGLGGRQGKEWEATFRIMSLDRDITERDMRKTQDEFLQEMLRNGVFPRPVMPGVFCLARSTARGECSTSSRDRMPDTGRCSANCPLQVQERHRLDSIVSHVRNFVASRNRSSPMQIGYWAGQVRSHLQAWPELEEIISDVSDDWPEIRQMIFNHE